MRHHQSASPPRIQPAFLVRVHQSAAAFGLKPGFITAARKLATPYVVKCVGPTRESLGDRAFQRQYHERRLWCERQCPNDHEIEPIRDARVVLVGYEYRFADEVDAMLFKMLFY